MRILKSEKGFSLVELLLVLGIMSFLTAVIYGVFINSGIVFNFTYEIVKATKTYRPVASIVATDKPFRRLKEYVEERFGQEIDC